jgi:hypothetical protein
MGQFFLHKSQNQNVFLIKSSNLHFLTFLEHVSGFLQAHSGVALSMNTFVVHCSHRLFEPLLPEPLRIRETDILGRRRGEKESDSGGVGGDVEGVHEAVDEGQALEGNSMIRGTI